MDAWRPSRLSVASWVAYDLANTIFALGVGGLYFAQWLTDSGAPDIALSLTIDAAMVVVIVTSPWIGAVGDHAARRVRLLVPTTLLAVTATFFLTSVGVAGSLAIYALALIGFNLGGVVYDALLPDVSTDENRGRVSGWGVGIGYVGSIIAVVLGGLLLDRYGYPTLFRAIALSFLAFALPAFFFIRERPRERRRAEDIGILSSARRLVAAWRRARTYDGVVAFLVGRFLYGDAINTLIGGFLTIFVVNELDFSDDEVQRLLALAIVTAIFGGIAGGLLTDRLGPRRTLHGALYVWMGALVGGIVAATGDQPSIAWVVGAAGGFALGTTWAADRVYMALISPPRHLGEFYGLYATVGRFATLLGPLTWGIVVNVVGLSRSAAMGALLVFVVAGRIALGRVDDRPRRWEPEDLPPAVAGTQSTAGS
jgi:UMF1 family MFS transporter